MINFKRFLTWKMLVMSPANPKIKFQVGRMGNSALVFISLAELSLLKSDKKQPSYSKFKTPKTAFPQVSKLENGIFPGFWDLDALSIGYFTSDLSKLNFAELRKMTASSSTQEKKLKHFVKPQVLSATPKLAVAEIGFRPQRRQVVSNMSETNFISGN